MEEIKTDVLIPTYNSEKYLDECLNYVKETIPVNKIIAVDHHSKDRTIEILKTHGADVYFENSTLAYARNLLMSKATTDVITWIDSDLIIRQKGWWQDAYKLLMSDKSIGAVVARVNEETFSTPRMKYANFWWKFDPNARKFGMTLGSTLIRREDLTGVHIPEMIDAREDRYIEVQLLKKGKHIEFRFVKGTHYFDYQENKAYWSGANTRLISHIINDPDWKQTNILWIFARRIFPAFVKAIPPALYFKDARIISWNTKHWIRYLLGWMYPYKYSKMKRLIKK
jgi:glycosyltransferase involved in cell wall biosynthesis